MRILLGAGERGEGALTSAAVHAALDEAERAAGRPPVELGLVEGILEDLEREGFCARLDAAEGDETRWAIR